ncbi:hypothetical protein MTR67_035131 [Solanum verrucosum]|uniref:Reverse transcriptase/retrotransposon-derived protein RNase H-like domain-containing protein n=1 Tax=Solanum verrucosum TaxID=315347 RepID=A0AAF0ZJI1_SOLVR|nr:hypothetical protein MTR67_035131 [Solanum verrucosum]
MQGSISRRHGLSLSQILEIELFNVWGIDFMGSAPLTKLTHKTAKFQWTGACEQSFKELKKRFTTTLILTLPDGNEGYVVYCDPSRIA